MKRVLVFNRSFFALSETFIYRQVNSLAAHFDLILLGFRFHNEDKFLLPHTEKVQLQFSSNSADRLLTFIARRAFHLEMPFSFYSGSLLNRTLKNGKIDLIHAHYGWNGVAILRYAKRFKIPIIVSFHGNDASGSLREKKYRDQLIPLFDYATVIILCSSYMRSNLPLHKYTSKVRIVPYGVDVNTFKSLEIESGSDKLKILHAGRVVGKKGVPDLIKVFASLHKQYSNTELQIIGSGEELEQCTKLVSEIGLEGSVTFSGAQPLFFVLDAMKECDVFVLNSRTDENGDQEGLPNALLEAMSCSRAVVSTRHAGIPDAVVDNVNGLLVNEKDNVQLYHALERCITDSSLRIRLGKEARNTVVKSFSLENMQENLCRIITQTIHAGSNEQ